MTDQIVWFFDHPTIMACVNCERTASYYTEHTCKECGRPMVKFTADEMEVAEAQDHGGFDE